MDITKLTTFLGWCTMINLVFFLFAAFMLSCVPKFALKLQKKLYKISSEQFNVAAYSFMGVYKVFIIFFNLVPYIALLAMQK